MLKNVGNAARAGVWARRTSDVMENSLEKFGDLFESYIPDSGAAYMHPGLLSFNMLAAEMV